MVIIVLDV